MADFNHDGIPDVAVLGNDTVSIYLGNGRGGFLPHPFTISAGLDPARPDRRRRQEPRR